MSGHIIIAMYVPPITALDAIRIARKESWEKQLLATSEEEGLRTEHGCWRFFPVTEEAKGH